jgi:sulfur carrier protein
MPLNLTVNGQNRIFEQLSSPSSMAAVIAEMDLKPDRVAVEHNGEIATRTRWAALSVHAGDRLEVVHFVGGGSSWNDK